MTTFELDMWLEAQLFFKNPELDLRDFFECGFKKMKPSDGVVVAQLNNGVFVAVRATCDKRKGKANV